MEKVGQIWVIAPMQMWLTSGNTLSLLYNLLSYLEHVYIVVIQLVTINLYI